MTNWGKKQREKKRIQRDEEVKEIARVIADEKRDEAQQTSQKIIDANNAKIEASFNAINTHLNNVDKQLSNVMLINAEQTKTIEHMNEKIDTNEIDRLRWEIISFANSLRNDDGQSATLEGYNHVFDAYGKYDGNVNRKVELLVAKHRAGQTGSVDLLFKMNTFSATAMQSSPVSRIMPMAEI